MLKEEDLYGIYVPVITPFFQSGEVDYPSFRGHIQSLVACGIHGLVINGTTGESPTVTLDEVKNMTEIVKEIVGTARIPIVIGTGTNDRSRIDNQYAMQWIKRRYARICQSANREICSTI